VPIAEYLTSVIVLVIMRCALLTFSIHSVFVNWPFHCGHDRILHCVLVYVRLFGCSTQTDRPSEVNACWRLQLLMCFSCYQSSLPVNQSTDRSINPDIFVQRILQDRNGSD